MKGKSGIYIFSCLIVLLWSNFDIYGQIEIEGSIDLPINLYEKTYQIVTAGSNGLILYREVTENDATTERIWELLQLNAELEVQWSTNLKSAFSFGLNSAFADEQFLYLLFKSLSSSRNEVEIFQIGLQSKNFKVIPITTFVPKKVNYFKVINNTIILGGIEKSKPAIVFYPQLSNRPVILQGIYGRKGKVLDIFHDEENNICTILYRYRNLDGNWSVAVKSYDYDGKLIEDTSIEPDGLIQINDARTRILGNRRIVAGTYLKRGNAAVIGYFSAEIAPRGTYEMKLFPLNSLNLEDTIPDIVVDSINVSADIKKIPDKHEHMLVRDIKKNRGQLLLLTETIRPGDLNVKTLEKVEGKVRFSHGALTSFDGHGDMMWYFEFLMTGFYYELYPSVTRFEQYNDTTKFFFHYKKSIAEQKLVNGDLVPGYTYNELELMDIYDEFNLNSLNVTSEIRPWYASNYLFISMISSSKTLENITMLSLRKLKIE